MGDTDGAVLFLRSSYFNHACSPNLEFTVSGRTKRFFALKDIATGEELTISYSGKILRSERMKNLAGFKCACQECLEEGDYEFSVSNYKCQSCFGKGCRINGSVRCDSCGLPIETKKPCVVSMVKRVQEPESSYVEMVDLYERAKKLLRPESTILYGMAYHLALFGNPNRGTELDTNGKLLIVFSGFIYKQLFCI